MINSKTDRPRFSEYEDNINAENRIYFEIAGLTNSYCYDVSIMQTAMRLCNSQMREMTGNDAVSVTDTEQVVSFFEKYESIPRKQFIVLNNYKETLSLDVTKVLTPLLDKFDSEFLETFVTYRKFKSRTEKIGALINKMTESDSEWDKVDNFGNPIKYVTYLYEVGDTYRYHAQKENIQNIFKGYLEYMTVPANYVLVSGDFDQIDLRVGYALYLHVPNSSFSNYWTNELVDKYRAVSKAVSAINNIVFDEEKYQADRAKYKLITLMRMYNASVESLTATVKDQGFAKALDRFYTSNTRYMSANAELGKIREFNECVVTSYFGTTRVVPKDKRGNSFANRCLNTPVQMTSNDIVVLLTNALCRIAKEKGYGKDKFRVYIIRHDEPVFMIHKEALEMMKYIKSFSRIMIDDWTPLTLKQNLGFYYKKPDKTLMDLYEGLSASDGKNLVHEVSVQFSEIAEKPLKKFTRLNKLVDNENEGFLTKKELGWSSSADFSPFGKVSSVYIAKGYVYTEWTGDGKKHLHKWEQSVDAYVQKCLESGKRYMKIYTDPENDNYYNLNMPQLAATRYIDGAVVIRDIVPLHIKLSLDKYIAGMASKEV